jgi:phosphoribosyl-dephospho-CoA transferase
LTAEALPNFQKKSAFGNIWNNLQWKSIFATGMTKIYQAVEIQNWQKERGKTNPKNRL